MLRGSHELMVLVEWIVIILYIVFTRCGCGCTVYYILFQIDTETDHFYFFFRWMRESFETIFFKWETKTSGLGIRI